MEKLQDAETIYDIIIIGGGPAGLTAGLYAARGGMKTLLVESLAVMGQAAMTDMVENYPGIEKVNGFDLIMKFKRQAEGFGLATCQSTVKNIDVHKDGERLVWRVNTENGSYETLAVVIASGACAKKLDVPGEKEFTGKGVSYCATCDGAFFRDKDIIVVGGGDTAVEEALFLTRFGRKVTLVHRKDRLRATKVIQDRVFANEKMDFVWESIIEKIHGEDNVRQITVRNVKTDALTDIPCDGVFIFVGWDPNTAFVNGLADMDEKKYIVVDNEMRTSRNGIFAAGDCRKKMLRQIVTACGDGATAAFSAQQYVERFKGTEYV